MQTGEKVILGFFIVLLVGAIFVGVGCAMSERELMKARQETRYEVTHNDKTYILHNFSIDNGVASGVTEDGAVINIGMQGTQVTYRKVRERSEY